MSEYSLFDIAGPIMVGPSSSHTAGAAKIGLIARNIFGQQPQTAKFYLHGSFAQVYAGHATDKALLGGVLGLSTFDDRIPNSFELAQEQGLNFEFIPTNLGRDQHVNTAKIVLTSTDQQTMTITGCSVGGGKVKMTAIDDYDINFSCSYARNHVALIWHQHQQQFVDQLEVITNGISLDYNLTRQHPQADHDALTILVSPEPLPIPALEKLPAISRFNQFAQLPV